MQHFLQFKFIQKQYLSYKNVKEDFDFSSVLFLVQHHMIVIIFISL